MGMFYSSYTFNPAEVIQRNDI